MTLRKLIGNVSIDSRKSSGGLHLTVDRRESDRKPDPGGVRFLGERNPRCSAPVAIPIRCGRTLGSGHFLYSCTAAGLAGADGTACSSGGGSCRGRVCGKPHPACYELGRQRVGVGEQARVLVVEDSPSGVAAGKAAGCVVLGLATTHRVEQLRIAGADCIVKDLNSVQLVDRKQGEYTICLGNKWVEDH